MVRKTRLAFPVKKSVNAYLLCNFSIDGLTAIANEGEGREPRLFTSCYMAHNIEAPPIELQSFTETVQRRNEEMVVGADGNSPNPLWDCKDVNDRGETLFNYRAI